VSPNYFDSQSLGSACFYSVFFKLWSFCFYFII